MGIWAGRLVNGDYQVQDTSEDAPLMTVKFHNQAAEMGKENRLEVFRAAVNALMAAMYGARGWTEEKEEG